MDSTTANKQTLRQKLKKLRNEAAKNYSTSLNNSILQKVKKLRAYQTAKNIALYLSFNSELPTQALFQDCSLQKHCSSKKNITVPVITSFQKKKMQFMLHSKRTRKNRLGINEPISKKHIKAQELDIIFVPLLGFDSQGNRIGMGGGYYDRALSFKSRPQFIKKPYLIGLAYEVQKVNSIKPEAWDIKLDAIITEQNTYLVNSSLR